MRCNVCGKELKENKSLCKECEEKKEQYKDLKIEKNENNNVLGSVIATEAGIQTNYKNNNEKQNVKNESFIDKQSGNDHSILNTILNILLVLEAAGTVCFVLSLIGIIPIKETFEIIALYLILMFYRPIIPILVVILSIICKRPKVLIPNLILTAVMIANFIL